MIDDLKIRLAKALTQIDSLLRAAKADHGEVASVAEALVHAVANVEQLSTMRAKCEEVHALLTDEEFAVLVEDHRSEIVAIEGDLERYRADSRVELAFFKARPATAPQPEPSGEKPNATWRNKPLVWKLGNLDLEHPQKWVDVEKDPGLIVDILSRVRVYERHTWLQIEDISDHSHRWEYHEIDKWEKPSRERLVSLNLDDQTNWYQFEIDKRGRLIGFREDNVFNVVWWDREHEVYKTRRKRLSQR